jgi:tetratricopeptide (TPR) repeat protein
LAAGVAYGLVQEFAEPGRPTLYHPPGLLRPWLTARLAAEEARGVHAHLARFWRQSNEADREEELRVPVDVELAACREHARAAEDRPTFRWATVRLTYRFHQQAEWAQALALLGEIPDAERDGEVLLALARVEESLGDWKQARTHLEQALPLLPEESKKKASVWHNLASVDLNEGSYAAARDKFGKALAMRQALGDRSGEAATFFQLGILAHEAGRGPAGAHLIGICWLINRSIGHCEADSARRNLLGLCAELGYDNDRIQAMLHEVAASYAQDRGRSLIEAAFPPTGPAP